MRREGGREGWREGGVRFVQVGGKESREGEREGKREEGKVGKNVLMEEVDEAILRRGRKGRRERGREGGR